MTRTYNLTYLLLFLCGSLLSFISSARAQACTPVVYAFRHAEDADRDLTEVGRQHADLYPAMVESFGAAHNYCPVAYVYSMYETNPDRGAGTNNPFQTAQPLAIAACYNFADVSSESLAQCNFFPRTSLENGGKLYEYLGAKPSEQGRPTAGVSATGPQLLEELISRADSGLSTAIFWSSQGLNVLGQAIAGGAVDIPGCSEPPKSGECPAAKGKPPRNAAYVFEFNGNNAFDLITPVNKYVQCFDVQIKVFCTPGNPPKLDGPPTVISGKTVYWCGNDVVGSTGNLPATSGLIPPCKQTLPSTFNNLDLLQGKMCDTTNLSNLIDTNSPKSSPGYYGYCQ